MSSSDLTARESEIIRIIKALGERPNGFVIIGGYAVNALGQHRFSVDCDLATHQQHLPALETILRREQYSRKTLVSGRDLRSGMMRKYTKLLGNDHASVELYVNNVVCRQTRGTWRYARIKENSAEAIVVGVTDSTASRVVTRELALAMKLHAGRDQDIADIVILSERVDWEAAGRLAACGSKEKVRTQLETALTRIVTRKFESDLKSAFSLRADIRPLIKQATKGLERLRNLLAEISFSVSL